MTEDKTPLPQSCILECNTICPFVIICSCQRRKELNCSQDPVWLQVVPCPVFLMAEHTMDLPIFCLTILKTISLIVLEHSFQLHITTPLSGKASESRSLAPPMVFPFMLSSIVMATVVSGLQLRQHFIDIPLGMTL